LIGDGDGDRVVLNKLDVGDGQGRGEGNQKEVEDLRLTNKPMNETERVRRREDVLSLP
jgi:hypothetical protein